MLPASDSAEQHICQWTLEGHVALLSALYTPAASAAVFTFHPVSRFTLHHVWSFVFFVECEVHRTWADQVAKRRSEMELVKL